MSTIVTIREPDHALSALKTLDILAPERSRLIDLIVQSGDIKTILDLFAWVLGDGINKPGEGAPPITVPQIYTPAPYVARHGTPPQVVRYLTHIPATETMRKTRQTLLRRIRKCTIQELDVATSGFLLLSIMRFLPGEAEPFIGVVKQSRNATLARNLLDAASRRATQILTSHDRNVLLGIVAEGSDVKAARNTFEYQERFFGRRLKRHENVGLLNVMVKGAVADAEQGKPDRARELIANAYYNRFLTDDSRTALEAAVDEEQTA